MATNRPHFRKTVLQLQEVFDSNRSNVSVLQQLIGELSHRNTTAAQELRRTVEAALAGTADGRAGRDAGTQSEAPREPPRPAQQTIDCRGCRTSLNVPMQEGRASFSCPACKAQFETHLKNGVFQVVWTEVAPKVDEVEEMTGDIARRILGVSRDEGFEAVKAAWRKACQQYHPDKHQGLPERLRQAAEIEMKRINDAYRLLERTTASDF